MVSEPRADGRRRVWRCVVFVSFAGLSASASASDLTGIWGVAETAETAPNCKAYVMVLRSSEAGGDGQLSKAILDLGTTVGLRDTIVGMSDWARAGDRLTVAPTLAQPPGT